VTAWWDTSTIYGPEQGAAGSFRWLRPTARLTAAGGGTSAALLLELTLSGPQDLPSQLPTTPLTISVHAAAATPLMLRLPTQWRAVTLVLPAPQDGWEEPQVELHAPIVLRDGRAIGVAVRSYRAEALGVRALPFVQEA